MSSLLMFFYFYYTTPNMKIVRYFRFIVQLHALKVKTRKRRMQWCWWWCDLRVDPEETGKLQWLSLYGGGSRKSTMKYLEIIRGWWWWGRKRARDADRADKRSANAICPWEIYTRLMCNEIATANVAFLHAHVSEPLLTMMSYDDDIILASFFFWVTSPIQGVTTFHFRFLYILFHLFLDRFVVTSP